MIRSFTKARQIKGELTFKGDKSISHRALIFAAMADGESNILNLSDAEDVMSTVECLRDAGIEIILYDDICIVKGKGVNGLSQPRLPLNAGNSGTTARLLTGLFAAQPFQSTIIGDESLSARPMKRVIDPLISMGAKIKSNKGRLPIHISPSQKLKNIRYEMPVASAQVKSALILAALHINEPTEIIEKTPSRNHTELMLNLQVEKEESFSTIKASIKNYPHPSDIFIPGDISSASFFIVLTLLTEGGHLEIKNVSLNPTRTGLISILQQMGGAIEISDERISAGEKYGNLTISGSKLTNIPIPEDLIPNIIDEIPALTIAGIFAEGRFDIRKIAELRVKETDRLRTILDNLYLTRLIIHEYEDGYRLNGNPGNNMLLFDSFGDHRIAMAFAVFSMLMPAGGTLLNPECVKISNPNFFNQLEKISK